MLTPPKKFKTKIMLGISFCFFGSIFSSCSVQKHKDSELLGEGEISELKDATENINSLYIERQKFSSNRSCIITSFKKGSSSWSVFPEHCLDTDAKAFCSGLAHKKFNCEKIEFNNALVFIKHIKGENDEILPVVSPMENQIINLVTINLRNNRYIFSENATLIRSDELCIESHSNSNLNLEDCKIGNILHHPFTTIPSDSGSPLIVIDSITEEVKGILCIHQGAGEVNECTLLGPSINSLN